MRLSYIGFVLLLVFETGLLHQKGDASKVVQVEAFEKLDIDLECDIFVSLGDEQKIVFEGPERYLSKVKTSMEDGVLKISCDPPGLISRFLSNSAPEPGTVKLYVKLTNPDQLIRPKKGNLISNEALHFSEESRSEVLSLNENLVALMKLLGNQFGHFGLG